MGADFWTLRAATTLFAYVLALGFLALFVVILWKIATDRIDLRTVILEKDGSEKSSISRFQLLVFTMSIAGLYVILSIEAGTLLDVPGGTLALLGISGGSFVISKGIGTPTARIEEKKLDVAKEKETKETAVADAARTIASGRGSS